MGAQPSTGRGLSGHANQGRGGAQPNQGNMDLADAIPELFRFMTGDGSGEEEVPAQKGQRLARPGQAEQVVDRRRQASSPAAAGQPLSATPVAARQPLSAVTTGEAPSPARAPHGCGSPQEGNTLLQQTPPSGVGATLVQSPLRANVLVPPRQTPPRTLSAAVASTSPKEEAGSYNVGDLVEIWSKSQQTWCRGSVEKSEGAWVHIAYAGLEGQPMSKIMPNGHEEIRLPSSGHAQGIENTNVQNVPARLAPPSKAPWDPGFTPPEAPPRPQDCASPQPPAQSPFRSPLHALQLGSPMPQEPERMATLSEQGPVDVPRQLFNLPGLAIQPDNIFKAGAAMPPPISPTPPAPDAFSNLAGGMDLLGSIRHQRQQTGIGQQPFQANTGFAQGYQGFQANTGLSQFPQRWQGNLCHSPSQPQSMAITPGALGTMGSSCATGQSPPQKQKYNEPEISNRVPLVAGVERIDPEVVQQLIQSNTGVLIDLRGDDRAVGMVPGAIHIQAIDSIPFLQKIPGMLQRFQNQPLVVFTCQYSAHRAPQCANWYREQADPQQRVAIMSGGFRGWEAMGLPVESTGSGDAKYAADAYALLQGVQFAHKPPVAFGGQAVGFAQQRFG